MHHVRTADGRRHLRALLVEDCEDDGLLLVLELRRSGFHVEHERVQTREDLARALDQSEWDVVLSDFNLPGFGGLEALQVVRERGLDLPFIIVSGTIGEEAAVEALKSGADDFIVKGRLARLLPAIDRELRKVEIRRERRRIEEELRQRDLRLDILGAQIPATLWTTDRELRFTFSSGEGSEVVQMAAAAPGATRDAHRRALGGEGVAHAIEASDLVLDAHVQPLRDEHGRTVGTIGVGLDVTDRVRAQRDAERQAAAVRLLQRIATAANQASSVEEAFLVGLERVCEHTGWPLGHVYLRTEDGRRLTPSNLWCGSLAADVGPFRTITETTTFDVGVGMVGTAVLSGAPSWLPAIADQETVPRREVARQCGLRSAFALPVLAGEEVVAVLEFFHTERLTRDDDLLDLLSNVGAQLGRVVERDRAATVERQLGQAQKMEAIGRLAGGIAHDFNNLLTVILGHVDITMRSKTLGPEHEPGLRTAAQAAQRAAALTRRLLTFSREQVSQREVVRLGHVVDDVHEMLARIIGDDVEVVVEHGPDTPPVVADRGQLEQVLMNLAVNARDAMPGGGRLHIRTGLAEFGAPAGASLQTLEPGLYAMLVVRDTGTGMSAEVRERIFEPFFTTKSEDKGTGLGLATVHGIVRQHQGTIRVESRLGEGTTFLIYLPAVDEEEQVEVLPVVRPSERSGHGSILVVEDDVVLSHLIRDVLQDHGYRTVIADSGHAALEHLSRTEATDVDLVLSDVLMPRIGGGELAQRIRGRWPHLPLLFMSGHTASSLPTDHALPAGSRILHKPFRPSELAEAVRRALDPEAE